METEFYDSEMAGLQDRVAATPDMAEQRARVIAALGPGPGEYMLELGTGNGTLLRDLIPMLGEKGHVTGLDNAPEMLAIARQIAPEAKLVQGSVDALPFDDGTFDGICAAQLLCFLPDVDAALDEAIRVLRPGGRVALLDTDWATLVWHSREPELMQRVMATYTSYYANPHIPRTLGPQLAAAGFDDIAGSSYVVLNCSLAEDTYARQTLGFAVPIMERDERFTDADIDSFTTDLVALDGEGAAFFSLNRYIFTARKPS